MVKKDYPIIGLRIFDLENNIIGGINTKIFLDKDIGLILSYIKQKAPHVEFDDYSAKLMQL